MKYTYEQLAGMIDHSLLHPTMTDKGLEDGCRVAAKYGVASVCIKPYAARRAAELLRGTGVKVGCVIGFPHGNSCTESKRYETELACRDGAVEIDMVANAGKALGGDWDYVERDVKAVCDEAHARGAKVKVIFENCYLSDIQKIRLCEICASLGVDWVKTSTGFGSGGATVKDVTLMIHRAGPDIGVKASGGIHDLRSVLMFRSLGCTRIGCSRTADVLAECEA